MNSARLDPSLTIRHDITRTPDELVAAASRFGSATLHEAAGKIGALPWAIKPMAPAFSICGPAVTVKSPGGDNLWLHRAIYAAEAGDVLVVHVSEAYDHGYWGEIMSTAASVRHLGGLVIDGCVRDCVLLEKIGFPVFARGLCIRGTGKDFSAQGWVNAPVQFADVTVSPGDLIVGDADGVVCLPREQVKAAVQAAEDRTRKEDQIMEDLRKGRSTLALYGWE